MLRQVDIGVLLYLMLHPLESYAHLAVLLGISKSTGHASIARLRRSGLVHRVGRAGAEVAAGPALEFLQFGVGPAFPADTTPKARGVPTGFMALEEPHGGGLVDATPAVWPSPLGQTIGMGVTPLVPGAPDLRLREPRLYRLLALVDALRLGDARERETARAALREAILSTRA
jgi:hypothetical protein